MSKEALQFNGWNINKATARGARMMQEIQAHGLLGKPAQIFGRRNILPVKQKRSHTLRNPFLLYIQKVAKSAVASSWFSGFILIVILVNCATIAVDASIPEDKNRFTYIIDLFFLGVYIIEFLLKVIADRNAYFQDNYNRFDFAVLIMSIVQFGLSLYPHLSSNLSFVRIARSLRAIRSIRSIASIHKLRVIVNALIRTMKTHVVDILACLFVFMFLFAVMGYYLFGSDPTRPSPSFDSLPKALMTLMNYVTSSNWSNTQFSLTASGFSGSEFFSIAFLFIGNFIFPNLFIGVISNNISDADDQDREQIENLRAQKQRQKKEAFHRKHQEDMKKLLARRNKSRDQDLQNLLKSLAGKLRHDEVVPMTHLMCNVTWLETFMVTQYHLEHSMHRTQQTHFKIANMLTEILDRSMA